MGAGVEGNGVNWSVKFVSWDNLDFSYDWDFFGFFFRFRLLFKLLTQILENTFCIFVCFQLVFNLSRDICVVIKPQLLKKLPKIIDILLLNFLLFFNCIWVFVIFCWLLIKNISPWEVSWTNGFAVDSQILFLRNWKTNEGWRTLDLFHF